MQLPLAISTVLAAIGMFFLSLGVDAVKVLPLGIRLQPLDRAVAATSVSYRAVGYSVAIVGFALVLVAAETCRRADKRVLAASPGTPSPRSFRFAIILGGPLGWLANAAIYQWLRT